ncbi:sugar ABC transporter permease [Paenibacillus alkaliterrae]|uniref:carbohydrate ABC transporter permease n=1 Tax=Paenibacillus alkaliterrae TaxID=320909 RepID=UPI001F381C45|nr:sugar ABC transporter permease [Paenibacillus alkaliterrae]MCF2941560.1 sugar ABC transporter permease [Paenibacillus alkaliterrae]
MMQTRRKKLSEWVQQLYFIGPSLFFFSLIVLIPFVMGMYYAFTNWNGVSNEVTWVGLDNFVTIFTGDENFANSFGFTVRFTITAVVLTNAVGFGLALLLTRSIRTKNALRTIFFLPNVIGGLLLGFIWQFIFIKGFSAVGDATGIGFFNLPWLGDAQTGFWGIVIVSVWQGAGYLMVIYIAGLINIPSELMEAADIDGANFVQKLKNIIIPLIMPAVTVCLFLTISNSFKVFDVVYSLTRGGPYKSTEPVTMDIYFEAFTNNRMGLGAAKALIFFLIVAAITLIQVVITKRKEVQS